MPVKKTTTKKKRSAKKSAKPKKKAIKKAPSRRSKTNKASKRPSRKPVSKKRSVGIVEGENDLNVFDETDADEIESLTAEEIDKELQDYELVKQKTVSKGTKSAAFGKGATELATRISQLVFEKKGEDVVLADLDGLTSVTDYFVIATATSDLHARAISDHVVDSLESSGVRPHHKEGYSSFKWILIDYVDVVVHIFQKDARDYYALERLWGDAKFTKMRDE